LRCRSDASARPAAENLRHHRLEEDIITAIVAAVLFAIALLLHLANLSLGPLDVTFFQLAGLVAVALHLAGIGATRRGYARRR
jgi:hypothetical protein